MKARKSLAGLTALLLLGCGASFDPATEIKSLRIIGVTKDNPYALPGEDVTLTMLWHDGSGAGEADPPRKVQINWLGGCLNPPGDAYTGCFQQYAAAFASGQVSPEPAGSAPPGSVTLGDQPKFTVHIPTEQELGAPVLHPSQDPALPLYGLSYVFFSLCAGQIVPGDEHFPLHCQDEQGNNLGPDDFIIGYSAIYFFALRSDGTAYRNANPATTGLYFGPADVTPVSCQGDDCLGTCDENGCVNQPPRDVDCDAYPTLCMATCPDDGNPTKCPPRDLALQIDPRSFEKDDVSNDSYGTNYGEQMWIDYYSTRGNFHSTTKLLNDATSGYNSNHGTQFYAPSTPGPVQIWIVAHDNRGGVSWVGTTLSIQ
jgi:hypothetical protein